MGDIDSNKITALGAMAIAKNLTKLKTLFFSCNQIGDEGAISISENLHELE
jgi:hypothetical protein